MKRITFIAALICACPIIAETIDGAEKQAMATFDKLAQEHGDNAHALKLITGCRASVAELSNSLELYAEPWNRLLQQAIIDEIKIAVDGCVNIVKKACVEIAH